MRVLQLAGYFFPENAASMYLEDNRFEAFSKAGIHTLVYTATPCRGLSDEEYCQYKNKRIELMYNNSVEVHRFRMYREGKNSIARALRYLLCSIKQFNRAIFSKNIDLIYVASTPPTQGALAALVKKIKHIPFVYNLQDIFPDSLVGTGLTSKGSFIWKIGHFIEDFTYRNADKIIVISEGFKENIMAKGVPEEKIEVVYNWVDENAVIDIPRTDNILFDKYALDRDKFYVTYCGNIGLTQNMDMLLNVAKKLETQLNIQFVLIGNGAYLDEVMSIIKKNNISNIHLIPFQPYEDISHVFSLGDVSLIISKPNVGTNSVPSKTWSIMSASRPVLANFDENEIKNIIEKNQCGIFTKAGDEEAFISAIKMLYNDRNLCKQLGVNGRQYILSHLTRQYGTEKYVNIVKSFEKQKH